jgi:parallel beta-helix repeat protein
MRGSHIQGNVVLASLGNAEGTPAQVFPANGIYLDENVSGMTVSGNVVAGADIGIYLHNAPRNRVVGNLLYGNRSMQICLKRDYLDKAGMRGNILESNSLVTIARAQDCLFQRRYGVPETDTLATLAGNRCCEEDSSGARCRIDSAQTWKRGPGPESFLSLARGSKRLRLRAKAGRLLRWDASASEARADAARAGGRSMLLIADSLALVPAP